MKGLYCVALMAACLSGLDLKGAESSIVQDNWCRYFYVIDYNHDLVATYLDFLMEWLSVPLTNDTSKPNLVVDIKRQIDLAIQFIQLFPLVESNLFQSLFFPVTLNGFLSSIESRRNSPQLKSQIEEMIKFLGRVSNYDGDDFHLTKRELGIIYQVLQINQADLEASFNAMDTDKDGRISIDEGVAMAIGFFITGGDDDTRLFAGTVMSCDHVRSVKSGSPIDLKSKLLSLGLTPLDLLPPTSGILPF